MPTPNFRPEDRPATAAMRIRPLRLRWSIFLSALALTAAGQAQEPRGVAQKQVRISGEGISTLLVSASDLATLKRVSVSALDHGQPAVFEGVELAALLARAKAPLGEELRGDKLRLVVAVDAADGYRALFTLPELDPSYSDGSVLLADLRDGKPLSEFEGPLRIVVPSEKRQGRWVRQVTDISLIAISTLPAERAGVARATP